MTMKVTKAQAGSPTLFRVLRQVAYGIDRGNAIRLGLDRADEAADQLHAEADDPVTSAGAPPDSIYGGKPEDG